MVPTVSLTLFWAVLTPLVLFLVLLPGVSVLYSVVVKVKIKRQYRLLRRVGAPQDSGHLVNDGSCLQAFQSNLS
jgi:hypothetical protein